MQNPLQQRRAIPVSTFTLINTLEGALEFWLSKGYSIVIDTDNELGTVHMEKSLNRSSMGNQDFSGTCSTIKRGGTGHQMTFF